MGRGDKKSKKGKIAMGSYGVSRPRKKKVTAKKAANKADKPAAKKAAKPAAKKVAKKKAA